MQHVTLVGAAITLTLTCLAPAQQAAELTQVLEGSTGTIKLRVPASWKLRPGKAETAKKLTDKHNARFVVIDREFLVPGLKGTVRIDAVVVNGMRPNALCEAWMDSIGWQGTVTLKVSHQPRPHVLATYPRKNSQARGYRYVMGRGVQLTVNCFTSDWAELSPSFFAIIDGLEFKNPKPWPAPPKNRRDVVKNGVCLSFGAGVSRKAGQEIARCVDVLQKKFLADHAPLPWTDENPYLILVNASAEGHREFNEGQEAPPICTIQFQRRILCTPIGPRGTDYRFMFVASFYSAMLDELYPDSKSEWMSSGEIGAARMRDTTHKRLPNVTRAFLDSNPTSLEFGAVNPRFARAGFRPESLAYNLLFRAGPAKYKAAYLAFLSELRTTGDLEQAKKTHLLSLDQKEMHQSLIKFFKSRLRAPRKKRRRR